LLIVASTVLSYSHAESQANERPHEIGGRQNEAELSTTGVKQAEALAARFKRIGQTFEHAYSSLAVRAMHTGNDLRPMIVPPTHNDTRHIHCRCVILCIARLSCEAVGYDVKNITTSPLLLEQSQGGWERQDREVIYTKEVTHAMNTNNWEFRAPGVAPSDGVAGESQRDVETRFASFIDTILASMFRSLMLCSNKVLVLILMFFNYRTNSGQYSNNCRSTWQCSSETNWRRIKDQINSNCGCICTWM
jgi:broad specificity phosphatase PhoE